MKKVAFACLVLGWCQTAYAQAPLPPVPTSPYRACVAAAVPGASGHRLEAAVPGASGHRLEHLLKAAEHLEAAGMNVEAGKLRRQAEEEKQAVVARIDALQAEVERLRRLVDGPQQVLLKVKMVEISRSKMRKLGFDFAIAGTDSSKTVLLAPAAGRPFHFGVVDDDDPVLQLIEALRKNKLLRVLAEPTLVTLSGRPASFHSGGEIPVPVSREDGTVAIQHREYGTRVDLVPIALGQGRIRLEVRARVSQIDPSRTVEVQGQSCPGLNVRQIDTAVELNAGQTLIISGLAQDRAAKPVAYAPRKTYASPAEHVAEKTGTAADDREETDLLIVITPEFVESSRRWPSRGQPTPPNRAWASPPAVAAEPKPMDTR